MHLEFTTEAGFIMYICAHDLNLARGSSEAPPALWGAELTLLFGFTKTLRSDLLCVRIIYSIFSTDTGVYIKILHYILPEMNREIASSPEKSEADFCARHAAALSRPRHRTVHTPPDWLLKRVYGAERGKREKTAQLLGVRELNVCT